MQKASDHDRLSHSHCNADRISGTHVVKQLLYLLSNERKRYMGDQWSERKTRSLLTIANNREIVSRHAACT